MITVFWITIKVQSCNQNKVPPNFVVDCNLRLFFLTQLDKFITLKNIFLWHYALMDLYHSVSPLESYNLVGPRKK